VGEPPLQSFTRAERFVGKREEPLPFISGDTHHLADDVKRNTRGDIGDEITSFVLQSPHDYIACDIPHLGVHDADGPGREPAVHQRPELAMARRVRQSKSTATARIATVILGPQENPACRTEGGGIAVHGADVIILCQNPESWKLRRGVPVHRVMFPEPSPYGIWITVRVQIRICQIHLNRRLDQILTHEAPHRSSTDPHGN
jgi:hypothetical protein